jgi:hypothetical protein
LVFFVHGFAKKDVKNITHTQEDQLKALADAYLTLSEQQLDELVAIKELRELKSDGEE